MKILWVKAGPLVPLTAGGRIRTWNILKNLRKLDEVTLLTYSPSYLGTYQNGIEKGVARLISLEYPAPPKYSLQYHLDYARRMFALAPFTVHKTGIPSVRRDIEELLERERFDMVICDFLSATLSVPKKTPCPLVLFAHNVETMIWKRNYEVARTVIRKVTTGIEYWKMQRFESNPPRKFDHILTVSEADRRFFSNVVPAERVSVLPTGVDLDYFQPSAAKPASKKLVFSGSMDWMANEDAILYFSEEILPLISSEVPEIKLTVAGRDPTEPLQQLSKKDARIELTGAVPDIRPYIADGEVYIVPLRVGGGTRLKIFEAMAMGKPVVSTTVGAEGLPVEHGKHLLLADRPEEFAQAVVGLLSDEVCRKRIGDAGRRLVVERYGNEAVARICHDIFERIVQGNPHGHGVAC
jgi:polysaccharide biosynthesis protein PslH